MGRAAIRSGQLILVAVAVTVSVFILVRLSLVVVPVVVAIMLASAVWPMVDWLRRHGVPKALAAWIALLAGASALGGMTWLVIVGIKGEWEALRDGADDGVRELERLLTTGPLPIDAARIDAAKDAAIEALSGKGMGAQAASGAILAVEVVAGLLLAVVVLFFMLKDGPRIWGFFRRAVPEDQYPRFERIGTGCRDVLGGYVRGTTIVAAVDAVLIGIALAVLGVPLALPLAVVVFLGAYIPLLGAVLAGALAALIALVFNGPVTALIVIGVVVLVNQLEGDLLAPVVLGRALSLHPLSVLLALAAGAIVAGVIGALLAVPLLAVIWTVINAWDPDEADAGGDDPDTDDPDADEPDGDGFYSEGPDPDASEADGVNVPSTRRPAEL